MTADSRAGSGPAPHGYSDEDLTVRELLSRMARRRAIRLAMNDGRPVLVSDRRRPDDDPQQRRP
jgi:hypothetical protein